MRRWRGSSLVGRHWSFWTKTSDQPSRKTKPRGEKLPGVGGRVKWPSHFSRDPFDVTSCRTSKFHTIRCRDSLNGCIYLPALHASHARRGNCFGLRPSPEHDLRVGRAPAHPRGPECDDRVRDLECHAVTGRSGQPPPWPPALGFGPA